jgi:hypothetical protein
MVLAHPMLSAIDRANLINANINPGVATSLGDALGFSDVRK